MRSAGRIVLITVSVLFMAACQMQESEVVQDQEKEEGSTVGLLQHNVYFYLNENVTEEEKADFEEGLKKLMDIEEVHKYQMGKPGSTPERDVTDHSFAYSIFSWFKTMEDYKVYADHPVHMEFIDKYEALWADVKVYDSEIIAE